MKLSYMNEQYICQEMNPSIIYLWHFAEERVVQKAANYHIVFWRTRFKTASFFYFFVFPPYSCRSVRTPSRPYTLKIKNKNREWSEYYLRHAHTDEAFTSHIKIM